MQVQPYLFFEGRCEEAFEFYKKAAGAEVTMLMRYSDNPEPQNSPSQLPPGSEKKVMHGEVKIGDTVILASDGFCGGSPSFKGFSLAVSAPDAATARKIYEGLSSDGGKADMPLTKTFFSEAFGMLTDKFGIGWMVMVQGAPLR